MAIVKQVMSDWQGNDREMKSHRNWRLSASKGLDVEIEVTFVNDH